MTDEPEISVEDRRRGLRAIIVAGVAGKAGDYMLGLLAPFLVLESDGSAASALFVIALRGIPYLISPLLGVVIDHFDRRLVYVLSQGGQAVCLTIVFVFHDNLVIVGLAMLLSGLGAVTASIASQFVILPLLSVAENRGKLISQYSAAIEIAKVVGLLMAAVISQLTHSTVGIAMVVACYVLATFVSTMLPKFPRPEADADPSHDLLVGFKWLAKKDVGFLVAAEMIFNLGMGALTTALVVVLAEKGLGPSVIALALAGSLLAGAVGSYLAPRVSPKSRLAVRLLVADLVALIAFVGIAIGQHPVILIIGFAVHSIALGISNVIAIEFRQSTIPLKVAGRVNSVIRMAITGAVPLSVTIYAAASGLGIWIWAPGLVLGIASLALWATYTYAIDMKEPASVV